MLTPVTNSELVQLADRPAQLLTARPVAAVIACPHCGRHHRIPAERLDRVITADCRRGQLCVSWSIPEQPYRAPVA
jgi:hypothetical protein